MDRQAGSTTEAQGERGLSVQDGGEEASRPRMRNRKVSPLPQKQESGRDRLAWAEVHHVDSGGINSGEEGPMLCTNSTQQEVSVQAHPVPRDVNVMEKPHRNARKVTASN